MNDIQVVKIIIVGDAGVGKTSLLTRFCLEQFDQHQSPTIGCDFSTKIVKKNGTQLKLQLWDVAGQEKFQSLSKLFIRGSHGCLVVSDITNANSLENAVAWKNVVSGTVDEVPIFLLQNKTDLITDSIQEHQTLPYLQRMAHQHHFTKCYQVSVKNNDNVDVLFHDLIDAMIDKGTLKLDSIVVKSSFYLGSSARSGEQTNKASCC